MITVGQYGNNQKKINIEKDSNVIMTNKTLINWLSFWNIFHLLFLMSNVGLLIMSLLNKRNAFQDVYGLPSSQSILVVSILSIFSITIIFLYLSKNEYLAKLSIVYLLLAIIISYFTFDNIIYFLVNSIILLILIFNFYQYDKRKSI